MRYTKETLAKINQRYCSAHYHGVTDRDLSMVNNYVELIENSRSKETPKAGDRIRYTTSYGDYYERGHIEYVRDGEVNICEQPYVPFIHENVNKDGINCNTSGGAWTDIPVSELKYVGEEEKTFCDWGSSGACASGTVEFNAKVNVWEYVAEQKYPYTTKTHNKMYISYNPNRKDSNYIFFGEGSAWETELDFQAWLETVRGEVFKGNWDNQIVVWYWKQKEVQVSPTEYETINGIEDTMLLNGCRRCKRIYDEENKTVITYFVWYWEDDSLEFYDRLTNQNEIRKSYECDWKVKANSKAKSDIVAGKIKPINLDKYLKIKKED